MKQTNKLYGKVPLMFLVASLSLSIACNRSHKSKKKPAAAAVEETPKQKVDTALEKVEEAVNKGVIISKALDAAQKAYAATFDFGKTFSDFSKADHEKALAQLLNFKAAVGNTLYQDLQAYFSGDRKTTAKTIALHIIGENSAKKIAELQIFLLNKQALANAVSPEQYQKALKEIAALHTGLQREFDHPTWSTLAKVGLSAGGAVVAVKVVGTQTAQRLIKAVTSQKYVAASTKAISEKAAAARNALYKSAGTSEKKMTQTLSELRAIEAKNTFKQVEAFVLKANPKTEASIIASLNHALGAEGAKLIEGATFTALEAAQTTKAIARFVTKPLQFNIAQGYAGAKNITQAFLNKKNQLIYVIRDAKSGDIISGAKLAVGTKGLSLRSSITGINKFHSEVNVYLALNTNAAGKLSSFALTDRLVKQYGSIFGAPVVESKAVVLKALSNFNRATEKVSKAYVEATKLGKATKLNDYVKGRLAALFDKAGPHAQRLNPTKWNPEGIAKKTVDRAASLFKAVTFTKGAELSGGVKATNIGLMGLGLGASGYMGVTDYQDVWSIQEAQLTVIKTLLSEEDQKNADIQETPSYGDQLIEFIPYKDEIAEFSSETGDVIYENYVELENTVVEALDFSSDEEKVEAAK